jgi:hypothetical protein
MSQISESPYGPFERGKTYELEYRARAIHRGSLVNRDLSDEALEIRWRLYRPPAGAGVVPLVDEDGEKLVEGSSAAGATGLWRAIVKIPVDAPLGSVLVEAVVVDTGVPDDDTLSEFREVLLDDPARTAVVPGLTVAPAP